MKKQESPENKSISWIWKGVVNLADWAVNPGIVIVYIVLGAIFAWQMYGAFRK